MDNRAYKGTNNLTYAEDIAIRSKKILSHLFLFDVNEVWEAIEKSVMASANARSASSTEVEDIKLQVYICNALLNTIRGFAI